MTLPAELDGLTLDEIRAAVEHARDVEFLIADAFDALTALGFLVRDPELPETVDRLKRAAVTFRAFRRRLDMAAQKAAQGRIAGVLKKVIDLSENA